MYFIMDNIYIYCVIGYCKHFTSDTFNIFELIFLNIKEIKQRNMYNKPNS